MKKTGRILGLVLVLIMLATMFCYAEGSSFNLQGSYPKDGSTGAAVENFSVKLYFDTAFTEEKLKNVNDKAFQLLDGNGKPMPTRVLYAPKEEGVVLVIFDTTAIEDKKARTVEGNTEYTLKIANSLQDDMGNHYGKDTVIKFKTMNTQRNMLVNMLLMFGMMGGMMFFTMKSAKKQAKEQEQARREEKVNPYKEARKTGKSVEEIVEKDQRDKAKRAEKEARKAARQAKDEDEYEFDFSDNYRVKGPRPISAVGSTYITGRKAAAEARKAEEEALKAKQKEWAAKAKNKKR